MLHQLKLIKFFSQTKSKVIGKFKGDINSKKSLHLSVCDIKCVVIQLIMVGPFQKAKGTNKSIPIDHKVHKSDK